MSDPVLAAIVARWAAVPDIGRVHGYERYGKDGAQMRALYEHDEQIRGWYVRRRAVREVAAVVGLSMEVATYQIVGFLSLSDANATEQVINDLVDAGRTAFRVEPTLGGIAFELCDSTSDAEGKETGIQVEGVGPVMFAGVLCHCAQLRLVVSRYLQEA
jgi:hypothetical protein